jgi:hypothetical protein
MLALIGLETSQQVRQAGASTDKVANEVATFHRSMALQNEMLLQGAAPAKLLEDGWS